MVRQGAIYSFIENMISIDKAVFIGVEGPKTLAYPLAANTAYIRGAFGYAVCSIMPVQLTSSRRFFNFHLKPEI